MREPSGCLTKNHIICKCISEFHSEEHADPVVSQCKLVPRDIGI